MAGGKHIYGMQKGKHIFGTAKVGEKGQIVIPKEARRVFGIEPGDTLLILGDEDGGIIISKPEVLHQAADRIFRVMEKNAGWIPENEEREKRKETPGGGNK